MMMGAELNAEARRHGDSRRGEGGKQTPCNFADKCVPKCNLGTREARRCCCTAGERPRLYRSKRSFDSFLAQDDRFF